MDPFDISVIERMNERLKLKCKTLEFFYEIEDGWRNIGIRQDEKILSTIILREPEEGNVRIENSVTSGPKKQHFNTSLRYLSAIIAIKENCKLESLAQSHITLYTMTKLFNCHIRDFNDSSDEFKPIKIGSLSINECEEMFKTVSEYQIIADVSEIEYDNYEQLTVDVINCQGFGGKRTKRRIKNRRRTYRHLL